MDDYTDIPYDDVPELQLPPANRKADLVISGFEEGLTKGDPELGKPQRRMITCEIEFGDGSGAEFELIRHWLVFPNADEIEEAKQDKELARTVNMMIRGVKRFCSLFGIDPRELPDALQGAKARGTVGHSPNEKDPGNPFVRVTLPRMPRIRE